MKVGDLVRVVSNEEFGLNGSSVWHEFMGQVGIIVAEGKRLHIPAFKVMLPLIVAEFDHNELELIRKRNHQ